jgi:hypothetical protein
MFHILGSPYRATLMVSLGATVGCSTLLMAPGSTLLTSLGSTVRRSALLTSLGSRAVAASV